MEETLIDVVEPIIDYTALMGTIISLLERIESWLQLIGTLAFLGAIILVAFGLVYMVYCILKSFML